MQVQLVSSEFQSTLPRRERQFFKRWVNSTIDFNPRSREGSDFFSSVVVQDNSHFNPRSREGSERQDSNLSLTSLIFQSTLPRRERQARLQLISNIFDISIHAPAKGATSAFADMFQSMIISIHAPAKGATGSALDIVNTLLISIHAPAKGATAIFHKSSS